MILLNEHTDETDVAEQAPSATALRVGMRLCHVALPRNLGEDRQFIAQLSRHQWHGIRLSDVTSPADIEKASALLRVAEANRGLPSLSLPIVAVLDTAKAALALATFDRPVPRLAAFLFDGDALGRASGAAKDSALLSDLRLRLPLAARVCGVVAFLTVTEMTPEAAAAAAREGYGGLNVGHHRLRTSGPHP